MSKETRSSSGPPSLSPEPPSVCLPSPLHPGRFLARPNRFVVHARLDRPTGGWPAGMDPGPEPPGPPGELERKSGGSARSRDVICHMADPGRLEELMVPGRGLMLRHCPGSHRKTRWSVVLAQGPGTDPWVSVDTTLPNRLVERALDARSLKELSEWRLTRREFPYAGSRLDFLLEREGGTRLALEVKSVTLVEGGEALFPDAVTARGTRHVDHLREIAETPGWEAAILFVLQRSDADRIRAARSIDPRFADSLARAGDAGVRILGRRCRVDTERVVLGEPVPAGWT